MQITVTIEAVENVSDGVWIGKLPPASVHQLGAPAAELGAVSVLLLDDPAYDAEAKKLSFFMNGARVLNEGSSDKAVFLSAGGGQALGGKQDDGETREIVHGANKPRLALGDRQLMKKIEGFPSDMLASCKKVIEHIRSIDPAGDLELARNRFVNRSDNFVAIEPQTSKKQLLINIRGVVQTSLPTVKTLNGYTAFKLSAPDDLPSVLTAISAATRKRR